MWLSTRSVAALPDGKAVTQVSPDDPPKHPKRVANPQAKRPEATRDDVNLLLRAAWFQGCWIERAGNKHFKVYPPDPNKRMVPIPSTPSGYRTIKNMRSLLRRSGVNPDLRG
jgi:hypothetical protein